MRPGPFSAKVDVGPSAASGIGTSNRGAVPIGYADYLARKAERDCWFTHSATAASTNTMRSGRPTWTRTVNHRPELAAETSRAIQH